VHHNSGKSLVLYAIIRWILETDPDARVLLIVPNVTLVNQMFGDFKDYSSHNGWNVDANCQRLYSGLSKELSKRVLISTWQSFAKISKDKVNGPKILSLYRGVICDEAHLAKGIEMQSILEKCTHAEYRIGATGTIDTNQNAKLNVLQIEGFLGPLHRVITTKQLIDTNQVSGLNIKALVLKYSAEECKLIKSADYQQEVKWLVDNKKRNAFLTKLALSTDGTTLLLVNHRDTHAKVLVEELLKVSKRPVYYIAGDVDADERERIRQVANTEDCIIVGTYQTMSTGVNLPNIRHVIFGFPSKSCIRVLQSIGRGLRLHKDKTHMVLWDIVDDLRVKKTENYAYQHAIERLTIYRKEQFDISIKELPVW
jgi:superfamily II DNA or RNA helicase